MTSEKDHTLAWLAERSYSNLKISGAKSLTKRYCLSFVFTSIGEFSDKLSGISTSRR